MANMMQPQLSGVPALQQMQQQSPSFFSGAPAQWSKQSLYEPQQMNAIQQILQMALGGLQNPQGGYEPFAKAARQNFQEQTLPGIAERFNLLGKGAASSGAFQGLLARGGADLESGLAQGAAQYGLQNQNSLQNLLGLGLRQTHENVYQPRQKAGWEELLPELIRGGSQLGAAYLSGGSTLSPDLIARLTALLGQG